MKTNKLLITALISVLMTSCVSTSYFQVYKAAPSDNLVLKDNNLVYEDENCKVTYNLWDEGGNIGFQFYNKTDINIYLYFKESFFILNGISYNYYRNRVYTNSTSSGSSASKGATDSKAVTELNYLDSLQNNGISATNAIDKMSSEGYSISYTEDKIVCIPSKSSKIISEYKINNSLYRDCDLFRYPKSKQIKSKFFNKSDSPLIFSNRIAYSLGLLDSLIKFENEFYVTEISNYPEKEIVDSKYEEYCGQRGMKLVNYLKNTAADKFYIKYTKTISAHALQH